MWPQVVVKELVDNCLDAAEQAEVAPRIGVTITETMIEVRDNGPGIPNSVIEDILDFTVRDARAQNRRREAFIPVRRITILDAAWAIMSTAYDKASAGGTLPVQPRQIMYAARGYIQEKTGRTLDDRYFTQTILPDYVEQEGVDWDIVWDARGGLHEPMCGSARSRCAST
jgi:hypothetical protein